MLLYNSDDIPKRLWNSSNKEKNRMAVASKWKTYIYIPLFQRCPENYELFIV